MAFDIPFFCEVLDKWSTEIIILGIQNKTFVTFRNFFSTVEIKCEKGSRVIVDHTVPGCRPKKVLVSNFI
jgi:hypothetical protein